MNILGIESSCDETAASVVVDGRKVLSNAIASQIESHKIYGGVVPEIASRMHTEAIIGVTRTALSDANMQIEDIDAIAVTYAPGLIGALLVGVNFAKGLALGGAKPLVPVHHLRGHIASNYISNEALKPPFMCLVVSGGHSHIVKVEDYCQMSVIGKTRDDAAGEAFDKAARCMGMPYPGGVHLDKVAEAGNELAFKFPHPRVEGAPLDFSFSGLKTSIINLIHNAKQKEDEINIADLSASYRKAVVDCLTKNFMLAARESGIKKLVLAGGVSANRLLRREMERLCKENGCGLYMPDLKYCGDNAAMIAAQGYYEYMAGNTTGMELNAIAQRGIEI